MWIHCRILGIVRENIIFRFGVSFIVQRILQVVRRRFRATLFAKSISTESLATHFWRFSIISDCFYITCLNILIGIMAHWGFYLRISRIFIIKIVRCTAFCVQETIISDINICRITGFVYNYIATDKNCFDIPQILAFSVRRLSIIISSMVIAFIARIFWMERHTNTKILMHTYEICL